MLGFHCLSAYFGLICSSSDSGATALLSSLVVSWQLLQLFVPSCAVPVQYPTISNNFQHGHLVELE